MGSSRASDDKRLDAVQIAHLRHWRNLARQPDNDWSMMGSRATGQDDFTSYRYQLAYMLYGASLVHKHTLPAAPGLFQPMIEAFMDKLQLPETWMYWRDASRGGAPFNAHLSEGYTEQWDPVVRDNIMFSAYVQSGALLHDYLFDSDKYAQPGSLSFNHYTPLWGGDEKCAQYDRNSLNEQIYWQMVRNGYLGVACEPNCIFQICNQPAILGFRLHDLLTGGSVAEEVTENYEKAWADFGRLDANGHYNGYISEDAHEIVPSMGTWSDAWCGVMLNMWNSSYVRAHYETQISDLVEPQDDGTIFVHPSPKKDNFGTSDAGWVAVWASEMGDAVRREGVLAYADKYLNPTYRDGGLYYPRNDTLYADNGRHVEVDPMSGNVLFALARLNISNGFNELYNVPWSSEHFNEPAIIAVDDNVDISQAEVSGDVLTACVRRCPGGIGNGRLALARVVGRGNWRLTVGGVDSARITGTDVTPLNDRETGLTVTQQRGDLSLFCSDEFEHTFILTPET